MHWTDNPNTNVTQYQIWRNIKGGSGPVLLATVGRGVQTYEDGLYMLDYSYTHDLLYYDVREYYSTEGTYSPEQWFAIYGELMPKQSLSYDTKINASDIKEYSLACYPNPFNPTTTINFQLPKDGFVTVKIFDITGNEVKTLVNQYCAKGSYDMKFDGSEMASGIYLYQIRTNNYLATKKMLLLK
ncbi:MAG: T9SS type A sorting domain-containing protein [Bacteroidetes bacterium]|nr:T9SS type A sorting domain-containing protein [Bacteroidota bacterium]